MWHRPPTPPNQAGSTRKYPKAVPSDTTSAPSPYGTRSRGRGGETRPNYAEDGENEVENDRFLAQKGRSSVYNNSNAQNSESEKSTSQISEGEKPTAQSRRRTINEHTPLLGEENGINTALQPTPSVSESKERPELARGTVNGDSQPVKGRRTPSERTAMAAQSSTTITAPASKRRSNHNHVGSNNRDTNMVTFEDTGAFLQNGFLVADDKTKFAVNDTVYLVCEPPGEPYYLARIMEFQHNGNTPKGKVDSLRINWIYRPRDIGRKATDTRLVFASMHSDFCPLTSLRGKNLVMHRSQIDDFDAYRKNKNSFYYNQLYERYIHRYYDVIPTKTVINVPERVKKVLDERWQFVVVESGRAKELTSAIKTCKRCVGYCANNDSVDCAMCKNTYHMNCVQPPLAKKPARGFAWSCGPCSRKQERRLEARNTPLLGEDEDVDMEDPAEDEENRNASKNSSSSSPNSKDEDHHPEATKEQIAQANMWQYRYLGIHCKVEDALDYDDRIYPRASSRLGPRHQANVGLWYGHHVEYVRSSEGRKKWKGQSHKKDAPKLSKEAIAALEAEKNDKEKRPKWIVDPPPGYLRRGEDIPNTDSTNTAKLQFRLPEVGETSTRGEDVRPIPKNDVEREKYEADLDSYMEDARAQAGELGLAEYNTNYLDKALELYYFYSFDATAALKHLRTMDPKKDLKEPKLNKEEQRRFEEAVTKYGSNLGDISRHVGKPQKHGDIVRYYYTWKKTPQGNKIWGSYEGRKNKKQSKQTDSSAYLDDVADDFDDSAFDNDKIATKKRGFECKYCNTKNSRVWRRAPQTAPGGGAIGADGKSTKDKNSLYMVALCQRCASLWRRYALQYESIDELAKRLGQSGGRAFRKKADEELLAEVAEANKLCGITMSQASAAAAQALGVEVPASLIVSPEQEAARKKAKVNSEKERQALTTVRKSMSPVEGPKKKVVEKPPEPALVPEQPKFSTLPCSVCLEKDPMGDDYFCCRSCRLTVHRQCYGIPEGRSPAKWTCEMCMNDQSNQYSTTYECVLCPRRAPEIDLYEAPKPSHKKKTDREREKERLEKEMVLDATKEYRRKQQETGKPTSPREPLKPTAGNKWVHVTCAVWVQGIKFRYPQLLDNAEGIGAIPRSDWAQTCKLCKSNHGVCITCHKCPSTFHVTCAQHQPHSTGWVMGFDVTPVKGTRRDVVDSVVVGNEKGQMEPVVFCRDHVPKTTIHPIVAKGEDGLNALQLFVRHFKQADISLTGTVRKADMVARSRSLIQSALPNGHNASLSNGPTTPTIVQASSLRASPEDVTVKSEEVDEEGDRVVHLSTFHKAEPVDKECAICHSHASPKWYKHSPDQVNGFTDNNVDGSHGSHKGYICHRCHIRKNEPTPTSRPAETHRPTPDAHVPPPPTLPHPGWSTPTGPPIHGGPHIHQGPLPPAPGHAPLVNGVAHTPPTHFAPAPRSPYLHGPPPAVRPYFAPNGYDSRPPSSSAPVPPPQGPLGPPVSSGPPGPYAPREAPPYGHPYHGPPSHGSPYMPNGSPRAAHFMGPGIPNATSSHGPAGPPTAASNPFAPLHPRSPRTVYHGSPRPRTGEPGWEERERRDREERDRREREERDRRERDERRTPAIGGANAAGGASASPSLRNLIH